MHPSNYRRSTFFTTLITLSLLMTLVSATPLVRAHDAAPIGDTRVVAEASPSSVDGRLAPLFEGLGTYEFPISTQNALTQRYFNQGMILAFGFNHAEAARSFQEAARLDPTCAMCHWGLAYVLGPNINAVMPDEAVPTAWEAIQTAIALSNHATERERAYIQAQAARYAPDATGDRAALNLAYANAMREVTQRYPDDLEAKTLFAEALMDTTPWDYWEDNGEPKPEGAEIMAVLEAVLAQSSDHPGANHLYIHAVEKERPELGVPSADRLLNFAPGAGHLVHMPSHIYIRVGRYHDAVVSNQMALKADQDYITQCHAQGMYPIGYMPHNPHFMWYAATMAGQSAIAIEAANETSRLVDQSLMRQPGYGTLQHYFVIPLYTDVTFSRWDEILATPAPDAGLIYPTAVWRYARGMALAATDRVAEANQELTALKAIAADPALESVTIWEVNTTAHLLKIATEVLSGKIAVQQGNYEQAIAHFRAGVELEDSLRYEEPSSWHAPVRHSLGMALLAAGRPTEAEQVYRDDLALYPQNGWSLYGLAGSLSAQNRSQEARATQTQFESAWQYADVPVTAISSR